MTRMRPETTAEHIARQQALLDRAQADSAAEKARADLLEAEVARLREALECARAIMDTPIARRRLNLDPSDERLAVFRAALDEHERTKG